MIVVLILSVMVLVNLFIFNPMIYNSESILGGQEEKLILFWVALIFPPVIFIWGILMFLYRIVMYVSKHIYKIYSNNIDRKFWKE